MVSEPGFHSLSCSDSKNQAGLLLQFTNLLLDTVEGLSGPRSVIYFSETTFHRGEDVGRDLWRSHSSIPLLKVGQLQQVTKGHAFEYLQGWRPHQLPGEPAAVLITIREKKKVLFRPYYSSPHQGFIYIDNPTPNLPCSTLNRPSSQAVLRTDAPVSSSSLGPFA